MSEVTLYNSSYYRQTLKALDGDTYTIPARTSVTIDSKFMVQLPPFITVVESEGPSRPIEEAVIGKLGIEVRFIDNKMQVTDSYGNVALSGDLLEGVRGPLGPTGPTGPLGNNIELRKTSTHLQWSPVGANVWTNLIALTDLMSEANPETLTARDEAVAALSSTNTLKNITSDYKDQVFNKVTEANSILSQVTDLNSTVATNKIATDNAVIQTNSAMLQAMLAASNSTANLDGARIFFTESSMLEYVPENGKTAILTIADGSRKAGIYRYNNGWPLLAESDTVANIESRVKSFEDTRFFTDEAPLPNGLVYVWRGSNGKVVMGLTAEGKLWFSPTDDIVALFRQTNPEFESILVNVLGDESPYVSIVIDINKKSIIRATKKGEIDFIMAPELARRTRKSALSKVQVTDRPPTENDDATQGYVVGNSWVYNKQHWICVQSYPSAVWVPTQQFFLECGNLWADGRLPLPGDALWDKVPLVAIAGMRVRASYNGPAMRVRRDEDEEELDINYTPDNIIDWPTLRSFMAGGRVRLEKIYNQGSAVGQDITWTGDYRPILSPCPMVGDSIGIVIENGTPYNGADPNEGLLIPNTIAFSSDSLSYFWAGSPAHSQVDMPLIEFSGTTPLGFGNRNRSGHIGIASHMDGSWRFSEWKAHIGPQVIGFSSSPTAFTMHLSDEKIADFDPYPHAELAGGLIGLITAGWLAADGISKGEGSQILGGVLIYDSAVTNDEALLIRRSMELHFNMRPQIRGTLIMDGDSIEHGAYGTYYESIARRMSRYLTRPMKVYLIARGGGTFASQLGYWDEMSNITSYSKPIVGICALGTNDFGRETVTSADDLITIAAAYFARWRTDGVEYIIGQNIRPRRGFVDAGGGAKELLRQEYNQRFREEWDTTLDLDALADVATLAIVGVDGAAHDTNLYKDGTHETDYGRALEAVWIANIVNTLMTEEGLV